MQNALSYLRDREGVRSKRYKTGLIYAVTMIELKIIFAVHFRLIINRKILSSKECKLQSKIVHLYVGLLLETVYEAGYNPPLNVLIPRG